MTAAYGMTRRVFLLSAGRAAAGCSLFLLAVAPSGCGAGWEGLLVDVRTIFADEAALRRIGQRVLAAASRPPTSDQLATKLFSNARWRSGRDPRRLFLEQIAEDFSTDRVEVLEGWVLSRSETRLAALVVLLAREV